jgi:CheY-like chemotaxis protein
MLVVDDDRDCLDVMRWLLEHWGYDVRTAMNGRDALEYFERGGTASLVLLDLMMPVMNGMEFLAERRNRPALADIPVIIVTAADMLAERGREPIVTKPVDADVLLRHISQLCS